MIDNIIAELKAWLEAKKSDLEIKDIYLFGSAIYRNGVMFDEALSDLDLIVPIPSAIDDPIDYLNWLQKLKAAKSELEKKMFFILQKQDSTKEIISIVPITQLELNHDIHKSGARNFFRTNEFLAINENQIIKGSNLLEYSPLDNENAIQVFEAVQSVRNAFLKNTSMKDVRLLEEKMSSDLLPKKLSREAAKVNSIYRGIKTSGDQFNLSYGNDFIKAKISEKIDSNNLYSDLYNWFDARCGGRSNTNANILSQENHLLFYEIIFNSLTQKLDELQKEMKVKSEKTTEYLNLIKFNETFIEFLQNSELLAKAHARKVIVKLDDIFVYPELDKYSTFRNEESIENSENTIANFIAYKKILFAGSDQSGKTSICKKFCRSLLDQKLLPIYISDRPNNYLGNINNKLEKAFSEQYITELKFSEIEKNLIVPILDDFHYAKHKEKIIEDLSIYENQILVVDDIFGLNLKNDKLITSYYHFKILELKPSLRDKLIKNWLQLSDMSTGERVKENQNYQNLDKSTELVNTSLGKVIGGGIMPAYPFFILSIISTYETFDKPLEQDITSQGHCYQALLYMYLRKQGVKNDDFDTYINFLTEISFFFYKEGVNEIDQMLFDEFLNNKYLKNFNLPVSLEELLKNLEATNIFIKTSLNNYAFCYPYIYYFFVGKYIAEHIDENAETISKIISNLHNNDNAYIAIFISHHTKSIAILEKIISTAEELFVTNAPSTLSETEFEFFDKKADILVQALLPDHGQTSESYRAEKLTEEDEVEKHKKKESEDEEKSNEEDELSIELRRGIKTCEVMGTMIKNRAGSIPKSKLEAIFEAGMNVQLRVITSFVDIIKDENNQKEIEDFLYNALNTVIEERGFKPSPEKLQKIIKTIFWNANFNLISAMINKIVHSLGSDKLTQTIANVCNKIDTPATFIVKHSILMWYNKNLQVDNIADRVEQNGFSKTAKNILYYKVVNFCQMHTLDYKENTKIEKRLKIDRQHLLRNDKKLKSNNKKI
jgi:hypothetical protein